MAHKKVLMRHPKTGAVREFYEMSVPHHTRAGWQLVKDDKPKTEVDTTKTDTAKPAPKKAEGGDK